jgi:hypothetical protein
MSIQDLEGRKFEIWDVDGTIQLVDHFLSHIPNQNLLSLKELEARRMLYWQDFKEKLMGLKFRLHLKA